MFDAQFKRTFARVFLQLYPDLILNRSELLENEDNELMSVGADPTSLDRVTVQLFSIRAITLELLEDANVKLLETLLDTTRQLLLMACDKEASVQYLVNNHAILTKRSYFQCTHDLRFVLDHQEVVDELFARQRFRDVLWSGWLEIWKIIQCANPHIRIPEDGEHVQHENPKWGNSLVFESDIHSASSSMMVTLENRVSGNHVVDWALIPLYNSLYQWLQGVAETEDTWYKDLQSPEYVKQKDEHCPKYEHAFKFLPKKNTPIITEDEPYSDVDVENEKLNGKVACDYLVSKQPVSFHVPMHRIFASLLHCVCSSPNREKDSVIKERNSSDSWADVGKGNKKQSVSISSFSNSVDKKKAAEEQEKERVKQQQEKDSADVDMVNNNDLNNNNNIDKDSKVIMDTLSKSNSSTDVNMLKRDESAGSLVLNIQEGASAGMASASDNEGINPHSPGTRKGMSGKSSYLQRLNEAGLVPKDMFVDEYRIFETVEELFRKVLGDERFTVVNLLHLMEHPLRCLVFHAQCYGFSSLWLRNGDSVAYEACFYKKNYWHSLFVDPDLTLIRLVMLSLAETGDLINFVSTMLQRFEAGPGLVGHSVETLTSRQINRG